MSTDTAKDRHTQRQVEQIGQTGRVALWVGVGVLAIALAVYVATLDDGLRPDELSGGDLITHQYAQVQGRPGNAPGYPLYTMGGWLWFRLVRALLGSVWNPVQVLSSYSTFWAILSLALVYALSLQISTRGRRISPFTTPFIAPFIAASATLFYAATYFFWYYGVTTEQYTSAVFQTLLLLWLAFRWQERREDRYLLWMAFVVGTCLANLLTVLFILPPLALFLLAEEPGLLRRGRLMLKGLALAALPLVSYAYVYIRGAQHPEWRGEGDWPTTWAWFLDFLGTQQGRDEIARGLTLHPFFTGEFPSLVWGELTPVVLVVGLIGIWLMGKKRAYLFYGTLAIYAVFCWADRLGNWYQVIIPAYALPVLGFAAALGLAWEWCEKRARLRWVLAALVVLTVAYRFAASLPRADRSDRPEDTALEPGLQILADDPEPGSAIFGAHDEWLALGYLSTIWGTYPQVYPQPLDGFYTANTQDIYTHVYVTREAAQAAPDLVASRHLSGAGIRLISLLDAPSTAMPTGLRPVGAAFGGEMSLVGVREFEKRGGPWHVALYWRALRDMEVDYTVSVRPLVGGEMIFEDGAALIQDHAPVWGTYPTTRWSRDEVVRDDYAIPLPDGVSPDGLQVVVYYRADGEFQNLGDVSMSPVAGEGQ